jgi:hypothetical protein
VKGIVDAGLRLEFKEFKCHVSLPTFLWECVRCAPTPHDETSYRRKLLNFEHCWDALSHGDDRELTHLVTVRTLNSTVVTTHANRDFVQVAVIVFTMPRSGFPVAQHCFSGARSCSNGFEN